MKITAVNNPLRVEYYLRVNPVPTTVEGNAIDPYQEKILALGESFELPDCADQVNLVDLSNTPSDDDIAPSPD